MYPCIRNAIIYYVLRMKTSGVVSKLKSSGRRVKLPVLQGDLTLFMTVSGTTYWRTCESGIHSVALQCLPPFLKHGLSCSKCIFVRSFHTLFSYL